MLKYPNFAHIISVTLFPVPRSMQIVSSFSALASHLRHTCRRVCLAVVCGHDVSTFEAVRRAVDEGIAEAVFVGSCSSVRALWQSSCGSEPSGVSYVEAPDEAAAARAAVGLVRSGRASVLFKGLVHTSTLLRAVLDKQEGLLPEGAVLTHIAAAEVPGREKMLFFSDAAVIPYPTQFQREAQVGELAGLLHRLGVTEPRIALNHCAETVSEKFPHTVGYAAIIRQAAEGRWGRLRVDGPLDLRTSLDPQCLATKGIVSVLEGRADALVLPDIETGNLLYKALPLFAAAKVAGVLCGTLKPVVLPSRGDDAEAKYHSLLLAVFNA